MFLCPDPVPDKLSLHSPVDGPGQPRKGGCLAASPFASLLLSHQAQRRPSTATLFSILKQARPFLAGEAEKLAITYVKSTIYIKITSAL